MSMLKAFLALFLVLLPALAKGQDFADFPRSGVLAANGNLSVTSLALPQLPLGILRPVPFVGSVSLDARKMWQFSIENKTARNIRLKVDVMEVDADARQVSLQSYQPKLKANATWSEQLPSKPYARGCGIIVRDWQFVQE